MPMSQRNKFEQLNGNLILYPDYGNLKGFVIIGIVAILFCYALYSVNKGSSYSLTVSWAVAVKL